MKNTAEKEKITETRPKPEPASATEATPPPVAERSYLRRALDFITFSNMPIRQKFLVFSSGVAIWFVLIAVLGFLATTNLYYQLSIALVATVAVGLLVLFAFWITRSLTHPINIMIEQIESLIRGDMDTGKRIDVTSCDEIGELSSRFNRLLDSIHELNSFKKVIEEDDTPADVYMRLGNAFRALDLEHFRIMEVSNSKNVMRPVFASDEHVEETCSKDILVNSNLCRAKKTGDVVSSLYYPGICRHFLGQNHLSHVCVPMIIGDSTGGIAHFTFNGDLGENAMRKVNKARKFIKESLPVLEAKRLMDTLKESSLRDPMTGLYNRRFLEEYSETLVASTLRRGTTIALLMCDVDFFKEINDTYGHNVGDSVLRETSSLIVDSVRSSDMVVRFGGEEFLAVLKDVRAGEAEEIAEKIRKNYEQHKMKLPRGFLQKTISIGVCEFPVDTENFWQAIKYADISLYEAKNTGRNSVVRFTKDLWTSEGY